MTGPSKPGQARSLRRSQSRLLTLAPARGTRSQVLRKPTSSWTLALALPARYPNRRQEVTCKPTPTSDQHPMPTPTLSPGANRELESMLALPPPGSSRQQKITYISTPVVPSPNLRPEVCTLSLSTPVGTYKRRDNTRARVVDRKEFATTPTPSRDQRRRRAIVGIERRYAVK